MKKFLKTSLIFTMIASLLMLSACFKKDNSAEQTVEGFLSAIKANDFVKARSFVNNPDSLASIPTIAQELGLSDEKTKRLSAQLTDIKYTIGSTSKTEDGTGAVVVVTLTIPDYAPIFKASLLKNAEEKDNNTALTNILNDMADQTPDKVKKSVAVYLKRNGDKWVIDLSDNNLELLNSIYGNLQSALLPYQTI